MLRRPKPEQIRAIQKESGMTNAQFCEFMSASERTVSAWRNGFRNMPIFKWNYLVKHLDSEKLKNDRQYTIHDVIDAYLDGFYQSSDDQWYTDYQDNDTNLPNVGSTGDEYLKEYLKKLSEKDK